MNHKDFRNFPGWHMQQQRGSCWYASSRKIVSPTTRVIRARREDGTELLLRMYTRYVVVVVAASVSWRSLTSRGNLCIDGTPRNARWRNPLCDNRPASVCIYMCACDTCVCVYTLPRCSYVQKCTACPFFYYSPCHLRFRRRAKLLFACLL